MASAFHQLMLLEDWAHQNALAPDAVSPDDWPEQWRRPKNGLQPLRHGDCALGLSASFAAVNALRLVSNEHCALTKGDVQSLLENAWRWASCRRQVSPYRSVRLGDWLRLVESLCLVFGRRHGQFIRVQQPWRDHRPARDEFFSTVERLLVGRHIILGLFAGGHYSVVRGYTASSLLLFDSGAKGWVKRQSITLAGGDAIFRHVIAPRATLTLRRGG